MAFIVFEGIDGSGKSTLIQGLCETLVQQNIPFKTTREPGGTPLAEEIRSLLLRIEDEVPHPRTELLLYQASRAQHVENVIRPHLESGDWVLCDRFTSSSLAFQAGGRKLNEEKIRQLNDYATDGLSPDLWVLLDLTVEESEKRRQHRTDSGGLDADRFELERFEFHQSVRNHYLKQASSEPEKWLVIDASHPPAQVLAQLLSTLKEKGWLS
ncbi:MAG: dTMP kinase [Bdellovibrionaceae bacterium]|nr:dTMP kinase [Pseudobdellovibrionaceae bacterium]